MPKRKAKLTHLDSAGKARMVDVGHKQITHRQAIAVGSIFLQRATAEAIFTGKVPKGDALSTARIAGILAAKRCGELIPLCHPLALDAVNVDFTLIYASKANPPARLDIQGSASISAKTGVEMEALTAVAIAALTIYDMCKAIDKTMVIGGIRLVSKTGGTSGR